MIGAPRRAHCAEVGGRCYHGASGILISGKVRPPSASPWEPRTAAIGRSWPWFPFLRWCPLPAPRHEGHEAHTDQISDLAPLAFASTSRPVGHFLPCFLIISHNNGHKTDTRRADQITRSPSRRVAARAQDIAQARVPHFTSLQLVPAKVRVLPHLIRDRQGTNHCMQENKVRRRSTIMRYVHSLRPLSL